LRIEQDILRIKLRASEAVPAEAQEMAHVGNWDIDLVAKSYLFLAKIMIGCRIKYIDRASHAALSHVKLALCCAH
jgi:hypothetical protein